MKIAIILLTFIAVAFNAPEVRAASIVNLSDKDETIEVEKAGGFEPVSIKEGRTWRSSGAVRVKFRDKVAYIEDNEEYAIWSSGDFGPQSTSRLNGD